MVLGRSLDGAAWPAAANHSGASLVFRNAFWAVFAITGAVAAAEPEMTPPPRPSPTSVLLPPIQPSTDRDEVPLPSHALPFAQHPSPNPRQAESESNPPASRKPSEEAEIAPKRQRMPSLLPEPAPAIPVAPQPIAAEREEETPRTPDMLCMALEREIKQTFPDTNIRLKHAGDMLVVSGSARNLGEATRILTLIRQNAPDRVVNMLRVPGEQQIMLRILVAEVNRAAAHRLGLDFGIGGKQATIIPNRPSGDGGSSTQGGNGWIGQVLDTLQDHHYARILGAPVLTTLNGQPARFQVGGEFPVPVVSPSPGGAMQGVHFCSYGVRLNVQPVATDTDRIRLTVEAEVRGADPHATAPANGAAVPGLKVRTFQSTVELQEGETLAVVGLVRGSTSDAELPARTRGVRPLSAGNASSDQELMILVSPFLLGAETKEPVRGSATPLNPRDIQVYLRDGRDTRTPRGDAPYLIGPRGYAGVTGNNARR